MRIAEYLGRRRRCHYRRPWHWRPRYASSFKIHRTTMRKIRDTNQFVLRAVPPNQASIGGVPLHDVMETSPVQLASSCSTSVSPCSSSVMPLGTGEQRTTATWSATFVVGVGPSSCSSSCSELLLGVVDWPTGLFAGSSSSCCSRLAVRVRALHDRPARRTRRRRARARGAALSGWSDRRAPRLTNEHGLARPGAGCPHRRPDPDPPRHLAREEKTIAAMIACTATTITPVTAPPTAWPPGPDERLYRLRRAARLRAPAASMPLRRGQAHLCQLRALLQTSAAQQVREVMRYSGPRISSFTRCWPWRTSSTAQDARRRSAGDLARASLSTCCGRPYFFAAQ